MQGQARCSKQCSFFSNFINIKNKKLESNEVTKDDVNSNLESGAKSGSDRDFEAG